MSKQIANQLREFFKDAHCGGRLTKDRRIAIRKWQNGCRRAGYEMIRIERLEMALRRRICLKGLYSGTNKYSGKGKTIVIEVPSGALKFEFKDHKGPSILVSHAG